MMTRVVLCGYRDWAQNIFESVRKHPNVTVIDVITSHEEYIQKEDSFSNVDLILFVGWSWIIPPKITDRFLCLGIHPSDLPHFRGGSPLQHQIINGVEKTKVTLMSLSSRGLDAGRIWVKEDLDLSGDNMIQVFNNLSKSSVNMLNYFFDKFPDIDPIDQDTAAGSYYKRRTQDQSELTKDQLLNMNLKQLYNFIRALTDPYPNAFIKDEEGNILYFKEVKFLPAARSAKD